MSLRGAALAWPALSGALCEGAVASLASGSCALSSALSALVVPSTSAGPPPSVPVPTAGTAAQWQRSGRWTPSPSTPASRACRPSRAILPSVAGARAEPASRQPAPQPTSLALLHRRFSTTALAASGGGSGSEGGAGHGRSGGGGTGGETRMSLGEALNQLVDAAIEKVESGQMDEAVSLLKEGLNTFEPIFPNSPELGELHNQAALLLLFQNKAEEAAHHAQVSLESTRRHFGASSVLTAHRLLRLGVVRFAQGKLADAAGLLREAHDLMGGGGGPGGSSAGGAAAAADPGSRAEAGFYLDCVALAHVRDAAGVQALAGSLRDNVRGLKEAYGADSMILSLALSQHNRLVNGGLEQSDFAVGEALLKQHIALLTEVAGPDAEDVAVARYKLATFYYANDMLPDAGAAVRQAAVALRALYPEEHDMLVLCKHRLGMICAAQGDHRSATQLLQASHKHFSGEGSQSMLAKEADIGLALAKFRAIDAGRESAASKGQLQQEALELIRKEIEALAEAIGHGHMLVQGATRYYGQLAKMAR